MLLGGYQRDHVVVSHFQKVVLKVKGSMYIVSLFGNVSVLCDINIHYIQYRPYNVLPECNLLPMIRHYLIFYCSCKTKQLFFLSKLKK